MGGNTAFVSIEAVDDGTGFDHHYFVRISRGEYAGVAELVYILSDDAQSFIDQLEMIETNRAKSAELINYSSGSEASPLDLTVKIADGLGHLLVEATTRKLVIDQNGTRILSTSISFELDREFFATTILEFKRLFSYR